MFWSMMAFLGKALIATLMITALYVVLRVCIGIVVGDLCHAIFYEEVDEHEDVGKAPADARDRGKE